MLRGWTNYAREAYTSFTRRRKYSPTLNNSLRYYIIKSYKGSKSLENRTKVRVVIQIFIRRDSRTLERRQVVNYLLDILSLR